MTQYRRACGCVPDASGFGYCEDCVSQLRAQIWSRMSEKDKNYDRHFSPMQSAELDDVHYEPYDNCSCHINPPCSYCTSKGEEDDE